MRIIKRIVRLLPLSLKFKLIDFILKQQGIEIKEASNEDLLHLAYRLRWEIYSAEDYINPDNYPNKELTDKYDKNAVTFLAVKKGTPIGSVRLIFNSDLGFPVFNAFNVISFPFSFSPSEAAEISKLCLKKEYRGGIISLGLLEKALETAKERKLKYLVLGTTMKLRNHFYKMLGIELQNISIGEPGPKELDERGIAAERYFKRFELLPFIFKIDKN